MLIRILWAFFIAGFGVSAKAADVPASSCSEADVAAAITSANPGDRIVVPAGNCTWNDLDIAKGVDVSGAGIGQSNITLGSSNSIVKQTDFVTRLRGFSFSKSGGGNSSFAFIFSGPWPNGEPIIFQDNEVTVSGSAFIRIETPGGVIVANNSFTGGWDDSLVKPKASSAGTASWNAADTMGDRDTTGKSNIYVETNTYYGGTNVGIDCDEQTRCVYRYNNLTYSTFNTHGWSTSPSSVRHWEVYNNQFLHLGGTDQIANQNWSIWVRGATGVIFDNYFDDIAGSWWGNKSELRFTIRGAESPRPQGACGDVSYPVPQQLGQNHDGTNYFTDPIYIWNNTGAQAISAGWRWGNPCGFSFSTFWQEGRDYVLGTAKPGYTPYTYPHPLVAGGAPVPSASISANPETINSGASSDLTWSSANVDSCTGTNFSTGGATSGTVSVSPTATTTYTVDCTGPNGDAQDSVQVTVQTGATPTATISANPTSIAFGAPSNLTWSSSDATVCSGTNFDTGNQVSGTVAVVPIADTTYTVTCSGTGGSAQDSVQVTVGPISALPEGYTGIAASYPFDTNIEANPDVIMADDFESHGSAADLPNKWDGGYYQAGNTAISTTEFFAGNQSLEFTLPTSGSEISNAVVKNLNPTQSKVHVRYYTKWSANTDDSSSSTHNGVRISGAYPGPGTPPDGTDFFLAILESSKQSTTQPECTGEAPPGCMNLYVYEPEQRSNFGDHWYPPGVVVPFDQTPRDWGQYFIARPNWVPSVDQWYSYELMIQLNTPGSRDGRAAIWINGVLYADWQNIRFRDVASVVADQVQLELHSQGNSNAPYQKWYDNVVIATDYIGPMISSAPEITDFTCSNVVNGSTACEVSWTP